MIVLDAVGSIRPVQFVCAGLFNSASFQVYSVLPKTAPQANYLIADRSLVIEARDVPQREGGCKFAIDQMINPETIVIRPGGMIDDGCLISGQIGTASKDPASIDLFMTVVSEMRRRFVAVKSYYVGAEALGLLKAGVRLTANPKSPRIYDLTLEN